MMFDQPPNFKLLQPLGCAEKRYNEAFLWNERCRTPIYLSWLEQSTGNRRTRTQIPAQSKAFHFPQKDFKLFEFDFNLHYFDIRV